MYISLLVSRRFHMLWSLSNSAGYCVLLEVSPLLHNGACRGQRILQMGTCMIQTQPPFLFRSAAPLSSNNVVLSLGVSSFMKPEGTIVILRGSGEYHPQNGFHKRWSQSKLDSTGGGTKHNATFSVVYCLGHRTTVL